jgi:hypothetical protein
MIKMADDDLQDWYGKGAKKAGKETKGERLFGSK